MEIGGHLEKQAVFLSKWQLLGMSFTKETPDARTEYRSFNRSGFTRLPEWEKLAGAGFLPKEV